MMMMKYAVAGAGRGGQGRAAPGTVVFFKTDAQNLNSGVMFSRNRCSEFEILELWAGTLK